MITQETLPKTLVAVVDMRHAMLFEVENGTAVQIAGRTEDALERTHDFGGWYGLEEYRVRNHAAEHTRRHLQATVRMIETAMSRLENDLLVIGGHDEAIRGLTALLRAPLAARVAGTFTIDIKTMTPAKVRAKAEPIVAAFDDLLSQQAMDRITEELRPDGRAVDTVGDVIEAVNSHAVEELVVREGFALPGVRCAACGWLGLDAATCPSCERLVEAIPDVVSAVERSTLEHGGRVETLPASKGGAYVIAGRLRFSPATR